MKPLFLASLVSCLAVAGAASAQNRCDLDGRYGAEVLARYPLADPDVPMKHRHDHIPWGFASVPADPGDPISTKAPRVIAIAAFKGNAGCDLLWEENEPEADSSQPVRVAVTVGMTPATGAIFQWGYPRPPLPWDIAGASDLTSDGRADVLWWNPVTGSALLWVRTDDGWTEAAVVGELPPSEGAVPLGPATAIVRFFDVHGDRRPGILWQPSLNASPYRYFRTIWNGHDLVLQKDGIVEGLVDAGYTLAAVVDFDGDGDDDLLQQRIADGHLRVCYLNNRTLVRCAAVDPPTLELPDYEFGWSVAGPR